MASSSNRYLTRFGFKFSMGMIAILTIAMVGLTWVFIHQSKGLYEKSVMDKVELLNRQFSILAERAIGENSFTQLQMLIMEAAGRDPEIKTLVISDIEGIVIASADLGAYPLFSSLQEGGTQTNNGLESQGPPGKSNLHEMNRNPPPLRLKTREGEPGAKGKAEENDKYGSPSMGLWVINCLYSRENKIVTDKGKNLVKSAYLIYGRPEPIYWDFFNTEQGTAVRKQFPVLPGNTSGSTLMGLVYLVLDTKAFEQTMFSFWNYSLGITGVLIGIGAFLSYLFGMMVTRPVALLAGDVRKIAKGNLDITIKAKSKDEVGMLVEDVERMRLFIKDLTENLEKKVVERTMELSASNRRYEEATRQLRGGMDIAGKIQKAFLPEKPAFPGYEIAAGLMPGELHQNTTGRKGPQNGENEKQYKGINPSSVSVRGFYDIIFREECGWVITGEISGEDVSAGFGIMIVHSAIHAILEREPGIGPSALLCAVNQVVQKSIPALGAHRYLTLTALKQGRKGEFTFSGMHQDLLVYHVNAGKTEKSTALQPAEDEDGREGRAAGRCRVLRIKPDEMILKTEDNAFEATRENHVQLEPGDVLLLYSDGVPLVKDEKKNIFGHDKMVQIVEQHGRDTAQALHHRITKSLLPCDRQKDMVLVVLRRIS